MRRSTHLPPHHVGSKLALVKTEVDILKKVRLRRPCSHPSAHSPNLAPPPQVNHPYIVRCYDVIEEHDKIYFFMELCACAARTNHPRRRVCTALSSHPNTIRCRRMRGGELFDTIVRKGNFSEADAIVITIKLISAVKCAPASRMSPCTRAPLSTSHCAARSPIRRHLHDLGIAHRDLKPENMLMTDTSENAECKITDFGLSKFFDEQSTVMQTPCGTPGTTCAGPLAHGPAPLPVGPLSAFARFERRLYRARGAKDEGVHQGVRRMVARRHRLHPPLRVPALLRRQ